MASSVANQTSKRVPTSELRACGFNFRNTGLSLISHICNTTKHISNTVNKCETSQTWSQLTN